MLQNFVVEHRDEIIKRCRAKVASRSSPPSTEAEIDHGVPMFLDQLVDELRVGHSPNLKMTNSATQHGHDMLRQGFTVSQVVHDYGDICQSITDLALERKAAIGTDDFRTLNRCLDDAIASAVTQYGSERDESIDGQAADDSGRVAVLAGYLRTSIHTASVALEVIKSGSVGIAGSTGTVLGMSLLGAHDLIDRLLAELSAARRATDPVRQKG